MSIPKLCCPSLRKRCPRPSNSPPPPTCTYPPSIFCLKAGPPPPGRIDETSRPNSPSRRSLCRPRHGTSLAFARFQVPDADSKPNLTPPVTTTEMALAYKEKLERLEPNVKFLMTLYLSPQLTVEEVAKAKANGIVGNSPPVPRRHANNRREIISKVSECNMLC